MDANPKLIPIIDGFPRPDWAGIYNVIHSENESSWSDEWQSWVKTWLAETLAALPDSYRIEESDNFLILSSEEDRYVDLLSRFLERALKTITADLENIASDDGYGKHVVLIFNEQQPYYDYISHFYPDEGEFILSSGVFLNSGYGHFAFPFLEMDEAEATSAHELAHACLRHLPIPLWLNEGFAVTMEDEICGSQPLTMDRDRMLEHQRFWNEETIQEFWSGESFNRTDEGSILSYELARYCLRALSHDHADIAAFANAATYEDAGEQAAIDVYGGSLGGLIHQFFGDGDWSPLPKSWAGSEDT